MTLTAFEASLTNPGPPPNLHPLVEALWHERRRDWTRAHEIAQGIDGDDAAWVHAYLHRREGDLPNARYWYRQAGKPAETGSLATSGASSSRHCWRDSRASSYFLINPFSATRAKRSHFSE